MGMDGMVNATLEARIIRITRDQKTYRAQYPDIDPTIPESLALGVAQEAVRTEVGYLLMRLFVLNERIDSIALKAVMDAEAERVGITGYGGHFWSSSPLRKTYG